MEQYLRTVLERSAIHAEYRESAQVVVSDVLTGTFFLQTTTRLFPRQ
jgi:hypothetical protein